MSSAGEKSEFSGVKQGIARPAPAGRAQRFLSPVSKGLRFTPQAEDISVIGNREAMPQMKFDI